MTRIQNILCALLISWLVIKGFASSLPKGVQRCKLSDPLLDSCMKTSAQKFLPQLSKGLPEIGIPKLEPLTIPDINNDTPVLKFKFTNNKVYWAATAKIKELKIDQIKKKITLIFKSSGYMDSHYSTNGNLLIIPIDGEGESNMTLTGVNYIYKMNYDVVKGIDGKDYWKILNHKVKSTPSHASFQFTNLFNGNKLLSDSLVRFANSNWKQIFGLLGKGSVKAITDTVVGHITTIFSKIPVDELFET